MDQPNNDVLLADLRRRAAEIEASGKLPSNIGFRAADHYRAIVERHRPSDFTHPDPILDSRLVRMERQSQLIGELIHRIAFLEHAVARLGGDMGFEIAFTGAEEDKKRIRRRWFFFRGFRRVKRYFIERSEAKRR
jgi:hypothetical protein